jgi:hypothetical protein
LLAIHTVPAHTSVLRHNPDSQGRMQAVDVRAPRGSRVLAPLPGSVTHTMCPDTPELPGCQIRGFLRLPNGTLMPFVLAHLQRGSFPTEGQFFSKGGLLGTVEFWEQHPRFTHVHWAFRQPGDDFERIFVPPPANIPILRAFELCGPPPMNFAGVRGVSVSEAEDLQETEVEDSEAVEHGDIEVLDKDFAQDAEAIAEAFEHGEARRLLDEEVK